MCKFNWDFGPPGQTSEDVDLEEALGNLEDVFKDPFSLPPVDLELLLNDSAGSACEASQEQVLGAPSDDDVHSEADPSWEPESSTSPSVPQIPQTRTSSRTTAKRNARRGRGRARSTTSEEEKRERNRAIQARYREKKKAQRQAVETEYLNTVEGLERAREENETRCAKVALLEKLKEVKDSSVAILEHSKSLAHRHGRSASMAVFSFDPKRTRLPVAVIEGIYNTLSTDAGHAILSLPEACAAIRHLSEEYDGDLAKADPHYKEVLEYVRHMTGKQLIDGWRSFAKGLGAALKHSKGDKFFNDPSELNWAVDDVPSSLYQLKTTFQEQMVILSSALQCNTRAVEELFVTPVAPSPIESAKRWQEIVSDMDISASQRSELLKIYQSYCEGVEMRRSARVQAVGSLMEATERACGSMMGLVSDYLSLYECTDMFASSPYVELQAFVDMMHDAGCVLSSLQRAKLVALACPGFPDMVQMMMALEQAESSEDWM